MHHSIPSTIDPQRIPDIVHEISKRLLGRGFQAFLVGGAVRDSVLGHQPKDWDVATDAKPDKIHELFFDMTRYDLKHETVTLVCERRDFEITTFRGSEGFGSCIEEDLAHRDFTLNAMAYDITRQRIVDPFGGKGDIAKKVVRAVLNPSDRFREDPLRMIRAIRFSVELGYSIDPRTITAITSMAYKIDGMAKERIRDELLAILTVTKPSAGFELMRKTGLLTRILPELAEGYRKAQNNYHKYTIYRHVMETIDAVEPGPILRLSALLHDIAKPRVREKIDGRWRFFGHAAASAELAKEIMARLRFSNEWIARVTALVSHHMFDHRQGLSGKALRRFIKRVGSDNIDNLIKLRKADDFAHGWGRVFEKDIERLRGRVKTLRQQSPPLSISDLAVNGHDVMEVLGVQPGPKVGRTLNQLLELVIEKPEYNHKETLLGILQELRQ